MNHSNNIGGNTPLHIACFNGDLQELIRLLEDNNINYVNYVNNYMQTALHIACQNGHINIVDELIKNGAIVDCYDFNWNSPLHYACENNHLEIVKILIKNNNIKSINSRNKLCEQTPLHIACENNYFEIIKMLLDKKIDLDIDINLLDIKRQSPLDIVKLKKIKI